MTSVRPSRRAYLLIELIAVVTLVALATAALLPSVAGHSEGARRDAMIHRLVDLDRRARAASLREGPVVLRVSPDHAELAAWTAALDEPLMRVRAEAGELFLLDARTDEALPQVVIDRLGRAPDYRLLIRGDGQSRVIRFDGLTGRATPGQAGESP